MPLPEVKKTVTQPRINLYAEASHDFNPIHIDADFAGSSPFGGTIAHGMLILAYLSEMMTSAFGQRWLTGGELNIKFKNPARPGDVITASGKIRKIDPAGDETVITCEVLCRNQKDETIITGEASVAIPGNTAQG